MHQLCVMSRDSSVGYGMYDTGFESQQGQEFFFFTTASRPNLEPTQSPIQWVPGALSLAIKRRGREADPSPPSSARSRMCGAISPLPQYAFIAWCSVKRTQRDIQHCVRWTVLDKTDELCLVFRYNRFCSALRITKRLWVCKKMSWIRLIDWLIDWLIDSDVSYRKSVNTKFLFLPSFRFCQLCKTKHELSS
jgi:hypothetical protein